MIAPNGPMKFWAGRLDGEKEQCANAKKNEGEDFVPSAVLYRPGHSERIVISQPRLSINTYSSSWALGCSRPESFRGGPQPASFALREARRAHYCASALCVLIFARQGCFSQLARFFFAARVKCIIWARTRRCKENVSIL